MAFARFLHIGDHDGGAFAAQPHRGSAPDAHGATSDDGDLAGVPAWKGHAHAVLLLFNRLPIIDPGARGALGSA